MLSTRTLLLMAAAGAVIGLVYAPFHAAAYLATEDGGDDEAALPWAAPFRAIVGPALTFDDAYGVYKTYGKILPLVFVGYLAGTVALHRLYTDRTRLERWGARGLLVTQGFAVVGATVEYWTPYTDEAFLFAVPALLLTLVGYVLFGLGLRGAPGLPAAVPWLFVAGGPSIIPLTALFGHIPMGLYVWNVGWIVAAVALLRATPSET